MADELVIETRERDGTTVVTVRGRAVDSELAKFQQTLRELNASEHAVLDIQELEYICSWGLGMLVEQSQNSYKQQHSFAVVQPTGNLRRLFDLLQMNQVLALVDSVDDAIESPPPKPPEE